jgi:hypothetical protein
MSKPDNVLRIEITGVDGEIANGDLLVGDSRAGTVQFHVGKAARRAIRRLQAADIAVNFPNYTRPLNKPE